MDMALVDPHIATLTEANSATAARELQTTQAKIRHRFAMANIADILPSIWTSDDDLGTTSLQLFLVQRDKHEPHVRVASQRFVAADGFDHGC
jgi:hypothetical protein